MIRFFLALLFPLFLFARENPFFPIDTAENIPLTSSKIEKVPPLKRAALTFPSTARILENITVEYKNLDGSIATKKIQLHNTVDWHLPLFISQSYYELSTKGKQSFTAKKKKNAPKKARYKKIVSLNFITFYAYGKKLNVITKDKLLRDFLLVKPHRIVCDFKRETNIGSYVKSIKHSLFKKIKVGTHKGYYRVVIELDGYYQYKIQKTSSGYFFTLL